MARIIEPASKPVSLRVLGEAGVPAASYATVSRPPAGVREGVVAAASRCGVRRARHEALLRLVPGQHGVSSPATAAFQVRAGPFMASHLW